MRRTPLARSTKPLRQRSNRPSAKERRAKDAECRAIVRARDGGLCRLCGAPGTDTMHGYSKAAHPEWRHELWNLLLGCQACHNTAHQDPEAAQRLKQMADDQRVQEALERSMDKALKAGEGLGRARTDDP